MNNSTNLSGFIGLINAYPKEFQQLINEQRKQEAHKKQAKNHTPTLRQRSTTTLS